MPKKSQKSAKNAKPGPKSQAQYQAVQGVVGGTSNGMRILGVIGLIILLSAAYLLLGQGGGVGQFPAFARSGSPTPQQFSGIGNSSGIAATQALAGLANGGLANTSQFTIRYYGNMAMHYSVIGVSSPVSIFDSKYAGSRKFAANVSSVEGFGAVEIDYLNITSGRYTCTNFNSTAISEKNYEGALLGSHAISCSKSSTLEGIDMAKIADFNFSQLEQLGFRFNYNSVYQSMYNGVACTYIAGSISAPGSGSNGGLFQECLSDVYYVPLSFSLYASGSQGSISLSLNETYMSNSSSLSQIESIPG